MWTFITTCSLAKTAEQLYPFLFSILALYYVSIQYLKNTVSQYNKKIIRQIKSPFTPLRQKQKIINEEYEKKRVLNLAFYWWNAGLSIFSLMGAMHLFPEIVRKMQQNTYREYWCESMSHYDSITQEWIAYFHLSKLLELGDTFFLVLRGKDPIFLHIYHHITVAFISWEAMVQIPSLILTGAFINYFIHFVMYAYFALQLYGKVPGWFRSYWITYIQIVQMVVGVVGSIVTYYYIMQDSYLNQDTDLTYSVDLYLETDDAVATYVVPPLPTQELCASSAGFVAVGMVLFGSYFLLFVKFLVG